jgi:4-hydroxy-3-methylbut-2-enyl diphosphate reductase
MEAKLNAIGIQTEKYNTTCPFVEKVWNRSEQIARKGYSIIVHGKPGHEETRATFSHSAANTPTVVITDMAEAKQLASFITGKKSRESFHEEFKGRFSEGFDVERDLQRIGVVNQTTMLASDTQAISDFLKQVMIDHYKLSDENFEERFADTRDTLCYATNDNQSAVYGLLETDADLAIVVGGYNSSNTSHLVELCEEKLPTYFIDGADKLLSEKEVLHYDFHKNQEVHSIDYLKARNRVRVLITSGASCPDAVVEKVVRKLASFFPIEKTVEEMMREFQ